MLFACAQTAWIAELAQLTRWTGEVQGDDDPVSPFAKAISGLNLDIPLAVSSEKLQHVLGYKPPKTVKAALETLLNRQLNKEAVS
jgi:hypothetical protein